MGTTRNDAVMVYPVDEGSQKVSFTGTSAASTNAVGAQTRSIVLWATQDCHIRMGSAPTALTTDFFVPASVIMLIAVRPGQKIAAIRDVTSGDLHMSEVDH